MTKLHVPVVVVGSHYGEPLSKCIISAVVEM